MTMVFHCWLVSCLISNRVVRRDSFQMEGLVPTRKWMSFCRVQIWPHDEVNSYWSNRLLK